MNIPVVVHFQDSNVSHNNNIYVTMHIVPEYIQFLAELIFTTMSFKLILKVMPWAPNVSVVSCPDPESLPSLP